MRGRKNPNPCCIISGCSGKPRGRGLCGAHYRRWSRHGDPRGGGTSHHAPEKWLRDHINHKDDECLIWPFARTSRGYPVVRIGPGQKLKDISTQSAARVMCIFAHGDPPEDWYQAAHSCGNGHSGCINPSHLRWATPADNSWDRVRHGTAQRGVRNHKAKLTPENVRHIRSMKGRIVQQRLAELYSVNSAVISRIQNGWSYLEESS